MTKEGTFSYRTHMKGPSGAAAAVSRFSRARLWATPQTAAHQAPPSLGFSRQGHWSGLPLPSPLGLLSPCSCGREAGLPLSCFYLRHPERFTSQSLSSSAEHPTVLESACKLVNFEVAFCPQGAGKTDRVTTNQPLVP